MSKLTLAKKIAAWLLLLCFVLPLSTCAGKVNPETNVAAPEIHLYAYKMAAESVHSVTSIDPLLAVLVVFFLPVACLRLKPAVQAAINFAASFIAGFGLWVWVFCVGTPQAGGLLAIACWSTIFAHSGIVVWRLLRDRLVLHRPKRARGQAG